MFNCEGTVEKRTIFFGKLAVIAFVFIVLNLWTALADWVQATNVWWFVGAFIILAIIIVGGCCGGKAEMKPKKKAAKKKK